MLKPLFALAAAGAIGLVLWKLLGLLLLPLFGVALGLMFVVIKFAIIGAMVWFAIWLFRRMTRSTASTA